MRPCRESLERIDQRLAALADTSPGRLARMAVPHEALEEEDNDEQIVPKRDLAVAAVYLHPKKRDPTRQRHEELPMDQTIVAPPFIGPCASS